MIFIYLVALLFGESNHNYEQLAADHFFETIWKQEFSKYKSIEFDFKTDTIKYSISGCRDWDQSTKHEFYEAKAKGQVELHLSSKDVSFKKRTNSNRIKLFIGTKIQTGNTYIVPIDIYKQWEFVEHYRIKLDKEGKILDVCHFGEVI